MGGEEIVRWNRLGMAVYNARGFELLCYAGLNCWFLCSG